MSFLRGKILLAPRSTRGLVGHATLERCVHDAVRPSFSALRNLRPGAGHSLSEASLFMMRINSWVWFSFVVVLSGGALSAACGASSEGAGDLLSAADGGEAGSTSGASGTSGVDGSGGASSGATGADASSDGAVPPSEAGPGGDALRCGFALTCALPGQVCCVVGALQVSCVTGTTCPNVSPNPKAPGSAALACSGKESCGPGLSCCLDVVAGQTVSSCQPSCASAHAQLCAPFTADPGCPGGALVCSQAHINEFGLSTAYATCGGAKN